VGKIRKKIKALTTGQTIAIFLVIVVIVAAALLLTMSKGPAETTTPTSTPTETATSPTASPSPKKVLEFVYGTTQETGTFDPAKHRDETETMYVVNTYDPLLYPTKGGPPKPWVAERWEASEDGKVWTFYIRKGIKFHSGRELTAEDVAFSMQRVLDLGTGFSFLWKGLVEKVEVVDKYTVRFYLSQPFAEFPATLIHLFIVDKEEVLKHKQEGPFGEYGDYGQAWLAEHDAGSGPYKVVEYKRGERAVLEKFDDYWAGWTPGKPERVIILVVGEQATLVSMLKKGEVDMVEQWLPADTFEALKKVPGIVVKEDPDAKLFFVSMNNKKPPFDDVNVRKAVSYAIDYEAIIKNVFRGGVQAEGPIPVIAPGHCKDVVVYHYDIEKAKEYMAKSKYAGQKLKVQYVYVSGVAVEEQVGLIIKECLKQIGIDVELVPEPWSRIVELVKTPETTPDMVAIFHTLKYPSPDSHTYLMFHPKAHGTYMSCMWYENDEVTELLDKARTTLDQQERYKLYCEVTKKVTEDAAALFIINPVHRIAYRDYVKGYDYIGILGFDLRFYNLDISGKP